MKFGRKLKAHRDHVLQREHADIEYALIKSRLRPEVHNLLGIRAALEGVPIDDVAGSLDSRGAGTKVMKDELTELLIDRIDPIAAEIERLRRDEAYLSAILTEGTATARAVAHDTITAVRGKMGLATI